MIKVFFNLPPGIHDAKWNDFVSHFGIGSRRIELVESMESMLLHLWDVGCKAVKIDGSFVTSKLKPSDFDGTWDPEGVDETELDIVIADEDKYLMKEKYNGELYRQDSIEARTRKSFDDFF